MNAERATEIARSLVETEVFKPVSGRKVGDMWIITAKLGPLEEVKVTFEIPNRLLSESLYPRKRR